MLGGVFRFVHMCMICINLCTDLASAVPWEVTTSVQEEERGNLTHVSPSRILLHTIDCPSLSVIPLMTVILLTITLSGIGLLYEGTPVAFAQRSAVCVTVTLFQARWWPIVRFSRMFWYMYRMGRIRQRKWSYFLDGPHAHVTVLPTNKWCFYERLLAGLIPPRYYRCLSVSVYLVAQSLLYSRITIEILDATLSAPGVMQLW